MNRCLLRPPGIAVLCILATILAITPFASAQTSGRVVEKPTLLADKISYLPGETMIFTGSAWKPGEGVTIVVKTDSAGIIATLHGAADQTGHIDISAAMPKMQLGSGKNTPIITATAIGSSGSSISTQFTPGHAPTDAERMISEEEFWVHRLTYPTGKYSPAWIRSAAEQDRSIPAGIPAGKKLDLDAINSRRPVGGFSLTTNGFTALGPMPERMTGCSGCYDYGTTQGRVNAIVTDPTTTTNGSIVAYLASVGGGVWKTTNCCTTNTTWFITTDNPVLATTSIDTLVIDPHDHNTIYAGTGDLNYGSFSMGSQGIYKSTDGGATWTVLGANIFGPDYTEPPGNYPQYDAVGKVRVDPNNSNNVVAGTKKGLWFSYDAGVNWTGPCLTNSYVSQRQDITGLELTDMGGGVTRILAAIGVRGFPTYVQYDLGLNGANGLYKGTMPASGCPTDFTSIARNDNGFVFGTAVTGSPYSTGALMNAGTGVPCNYPITGGTATYCGGPTGGSVNNLGRMDIAVAPSNPNVIYAQVGSIDWNGNSGCGTTTGCQLGAWASADGGTTWSFMAGSAGGSLLNCTSGAGDYPQNWYDQGIVVDPNNPDRVFFDTFDIWLANRTGTSWYDLTCGYNGTSVSNHVVHVDQHALQFVNGSSDILLVGNDGGTHYTLNASSAVIGTTRPTWVNNDAGLNTIEFYSGDISGNFATSATPSAVGGAQDNGPSSVKFTGSPTGAVQWQMGLGGDGFSGLIDPMGTGSTQAQGTMTVASLGSIGQQFQIGSQVFTFVTTRASTGQVTLGTSTTTEATNIVTAITADLVGVVTASRSGSTVTVTAVNGGSAGNTIIFNNINVTGLTMNGGGFLGGTRQGDDIGSLRYFEGNNSGGFSRCLFNCTSGGASWSSVRGSWTSDTQSFVLPVHLFHGGIPGGDDCQSAGTTTGCGHLLAGTTRVWETTTGAASSVTWYVTNNPITANLTKQTLGNRSYINQVKYSPKYQSVAIVGTNDGNVQIGFGLGTGTQAQATWVDVTGGNTVLPNRPIMGIALAPDAPSASVPTGYAAVGGFNANSPTTPGHVFRVDCTANCATFTWADKTGNLPDIPVDSIIVNPNYPQQVFAGTDFGLYFTDDVTVASPVWKRFNNGLPNVMIWDMSVDRGSTTLALWTRSRGAYAWPLPTGAAGITAPAKNSTLPGPTVTFTWTQEAGATSYQIWVGSTPGGNDYGYCGATGLSCTVSGLPQDGSSVYATLWSFDGSTWTQLDTAQYTASTVSNAVITSPAKGSTLVGSTTTFTWSAEANATAYQVWAGTTPGTHDLGYCGSASLSCAIGNLPQNGQPVYVTLYGLAGNVWAVQDTATYNTSGPAQITSPAKNSVLPGDTVTFTWTPETDATSYQLWVGTAPGGYDITYGGTSDTTITLAGLPTNGSTVYVTLWGYAGGVWSQQDTAQYTAFSGTNIKRKK